MARYKVSKNSGTDDSKRITTTKYWLKRHNAQAYADKTNDMFRRANARVLKVK